MTAVLNVVFLSLLFLVCPIVAQGQTGDNDVSTPIIDYANIANRAEAQAIDAIEQGRLKEGLAFMRHALDVDPSPFRCLNYASVLFGEGVGEFNRGRKKQGIKILKEAENQLSRAIADFDPQEHAVFVAHAYFLLGEIYRHGFLDQLLAREFYYKSVQYHDNAPSRKAIEDIRRIP